MYKATQLTERSWILYDRTKTCGLMHQDDQDEYHIIGGPYAGVYDKLDSLLEKIGGELKFTKSKTMKKNVENFIHGYPTKHQEIFDIDSSGEYPTYTKRSNSSDRYAAGYWCFLYKGKWQKSYCPRIKTVEEYENIGPFKTKIEMDHRIKMENQK